jgi:hypothetical protein
VSPKERPGKTQIAVSVSAQLADRAKNVVYWTPGATLAAVVAEGLEHVLLRKEAANGGPFKQRPEGLRRGRPPVNAEEKK